MRDTKILSKFSEDSQKKWKEMQLFINLKKEVNSKTKEVSYDGDLGNLFFEFTSKSRIEIIKEIAKIR